MMRVWNNLLVIFLALLVISCEYFSKEMPKHAVARVGDKYLYKEEIASVLPQDYSKEDSINIAQKYVNNWAIKELLLAKAYQNVTNEDKEDFERLVSDYRADLYINSYKEGLINNGIDTVVTDKEMQLFYEQNKEIFKLNEELIKLRYIQLPLSEKQKKINMFEEKFRRFDASDRRELDSLSLQFVSIYLNDSVWIKTESVLKKLPFLGEKLSAERQLFLNHKTSDGIYLIQVSDVLHKNEQAPIEYTLPTLRQIIQNQRKLEFVKKLEIDIINTGIKKKQFEIIYE